MKKELTPEQRAKRNAYAKQWREKNQEKRKAIYSKYNKKKWANSTKEEKALVAKQCKKWHSKEYNENPEFKAKCLKKGKQWRAENPERVKEIDLEWHRKRYKEDSAWRKERVNLVQKWRKDNPEKFVEQKIKYNRTRRARKHNVNESYNSIDEKYTRDLFNNTCVKCGTTENLCIDHWKPLSKGYALTRENAVVLCRECNLQKFNNMPEDYFPPEFVEKVENILNNK